MANYLIEFDTLSGHNPGTGAVLPPDVLALTGWRSIGDPQGGRFINQTGVTIRSIYLKIGDPGTNAFDITANSGGRLFRTIWTRANGAGPVTEVYFLDGNVPSGFYAFWMRVPVNTQAEIQSCDSGNSCPFSGKVLENNPSFPQEPDWSVFHVSPPPVDPILAELVAVAPSEYRDIDTFGTSDDGRHTIFASHGEVFLFHRDSKAVTRYTGAKPGTAPKLDAIHFDSSKKFFRLLQGGRTLLRVRTDNVEMRSVEE